MSPVIPGLPIQYGDRKRADWHKRDSCEASISTAVWTKTLDASSTPQRLTSSPLVLLRIPPPPNYGDTEQQVLYQESC
ncbi:hypothetical protein TNCV_1201321 [Trichonephila clavipes]|nr:hypothetical protein TNCV_1201321 [Trichonephila clavipes]